MDVLRDAALVLFIPKKKIGTIQEHRLFVLPVVQSYMNRIPDDVRQGVYATTCRFVGVHMSPAKGPSDLEFKRDIAAISAQDINI